MSIASVEPSVLTAKCTHTDPTMIVERDEHGYPVVVQNPDVVIDFDTGGNPRVIVRCFACSRSWTGEIAPVHYNSD